MQNTKLVSGNSTAFGCDNISVTFFLVEQFSENMLHFTVIASNVDKRTGRFNGLNCHGEEKVRRFEQKYPGCRIVSFYTDSYSDYPMAQRAEQAYLVCQDKLYKWIVDSERKEIV